MKDLHPTISENLVFLRKSNKLTQSQLAERIGYSDKAVSRWETQDALPDINVLYELCDFYGVTLDALVTKGGVSDQSPVKMRSSIRYGIATGCLAVMFVWLIATITFIYIQMRSSESFWQVFVWAIPCSCLVILLVNRKYRNSMVLLISTSLFIWSFLAALYLQFLEYNFWLMFIAGIPLQAICITWFVVKKFK